MAESLTVHHKPTSFSRKAKAHEEFLARASESEALPH